MYYCLIIYNQPQREEKMVLHSGWIFVLTTMGKSVCFGQKDLFQPGTCRHIRRTRKRKTKKKLEWDKNMGLQWFAIYGGRDGHPSSLRVCGPTTWLFKTRAHWKQNKDAVSPQAVLMSVNFLSQVKIHKLRNGGRPQCLPDRVVGVSSFHPL